jgi:hypothetical protein
MNIGKISKHIDNEALVSIEVIFNDKPLSFNIFRNFMNQYICLFLNHGHVAHHQVFEKPLQTSYCSTYVALHVVVCNTYATPSMASLRVCLVELWILKSCCELWKT